MFGSISRCEFWSPSSSVDFWGCCGIHRPQRKQTWHLSRSSWGMGWDKRIRHNMRSLMNIVRKYPVTAYWLVFIIFIKKSYHFRDSSKMIHRCLLTSTTMVSSCNTISLFWNLVKPFETVLQLSTVARKEKLVFPEMTGETGFPMLSSRFRCFLVRFPEDRHGKGGGHCQPGKKSGILKPYSRGCALWHEAAKEAEGKSCELDF